jgi:hypothetical protein
MTAPEGNDSRVTIPTCSRRARRRVPPGRGGKPDDEGDPHFGLGHGCRAR